MEPKIFSKKEYETAKEVWENYKEWNQDSTFPFFNDFCNEMITGGKIIAGTWRINNGILSCGTLRIARMDYDTDPLDCIKKKFEEHILERLNQDVPVQTNNRQSAPCCNGFNDPVTGDYIHAPNCM